MTGWALWKPGHIGVFIGNGWCIEAKGINYGTIKTKVSATAWQKVLKLCDIDYSSDQVPVTYHEGFQPTADGQRWWYQYSALMPAMVGTGCGRQQMVRADGICLTEKETCLQGISWIRRGKLFFFVRIRDPMRASV